MEIVFVRHGQPEWVREGLNQENPPLTELGHAQAAAMGTTLGREHFDEVFCSPLVRARQTAAPLFEALDRDERIAPWLEEIGDPAWHGTPAEKAQAAYEEITSRPVDDGAQAAWTPPPIEEVRAQILEHRPEVVFAPHVETSAGLHLLAMHTEPLAGLLHLQPLPAGIWGYILVAASANIAFNEGLKAFHRWREPAADGSST